MTVLREQVVMQGQRAERARRFVQDLSFDHRAIEREIRRDSTKPLDRHDRLEANEAVRVLEC